IRRRGDVPVVPRYARGAAFDARTGQYLAPGPLRAARAEVQRGGARLRRGLRRAGPLRLVQRLPARVPDWRRHGEDEGGIPVPLSPTSRLDAQGPADSLPAALRAAGLARGPARERSPTRHAAHAGVCGSKIAAEMAPGCL